MALRRLPVAAPVPGPPPHAARARPLDAEPHPPAPAPGGPSGRVRADPRDRGGQGVAQRPRPGGRLHLPAGRRVDEGHRAARHPGELCRVRPALGHRGGRADPHGRGRPAAGPEAHRQEDVQPRVGVAHRSRRPHCQAEGRPHPLGLQARARGGPGDRRHRRGGGAPGGRGGPGVGGGQPDPGRGQPADRPRRRPGGAAEDPAATDEDDPAADAAPDRAGRSSPTKATTRPPCSGA